MLSKISKVKLPLILLAEVLICLAFGHIIPIEAKSFLYAVSLSMKAVLMFILPLIVFSFVTSSLCDLKQGAFSFVVMLFVLVCSSNFFSTCLSGFLGSLAFNSLGFSASMQTSLVELQPLWLFTLPKIVPNDVALGVGLVLGLVLSMFSWQKGKEIAKWLQKLSVLILNKLFIPVIPVFLVGFLLKLQHDQVLTVICRSYLSIFVMIAVLLVVYLTLFYGVLTNFEPKQWRQSIRNMFPAGIAGFSAMSSAAAMPLTLQASEKNTQNPTVVRGVVPVTTNIHLIGDCFGIPIMALAIMLSFGHDLPSLSQYVIFASYFVLAKFAVAAVPGGGILVMLPVLEQHLGFSSEMLSLITVMYMIFDPVLTGSNVMGNGGFAMLMARVVTLMKRPKGVVA